MYDEKYADVLSPYQVATLRIMSAGIVLIPFVVKAIKAIPKKDVGYVILSGLLGSFFPAYLFCIAETKLDSSFTGILNALTPLFTVIIGVAFFKMKSSFQKIMGLLVGFIGLFLLIAPNGHIDFKNFSYSALVLLATVLYGLNVNMVHRNMHHVGSTNIATVAFVFLIIPCLVILYFTGYFSLPLQQTTYIKSTVASCVLGIMGTAIASILFYMLLKRAGALFASMVTYGIPFIAVLWGLQQGENITRAKIISLLIILVGVYLANTNLKRKNKTNEVVDVIDE